MGGSAANNKPASDRLKYGEGQREQYGEGYRNRPEDMTEGAQESADHGWAGGDHDEQKVAPTNRPPEKGKPKG